MRILLLVHAFNSLAQRLFVELAERGHDLTIEFDVNDAVTREAVAAVRPDLVLAPFLKRAIPEDVWRRVPCLIVHPGPPGDRGPSSLDWAVLEGAERWGVTVLQADGEFDAGPVWASQTFPMRDAAKAGLYRREVTEAAVTAVMQALERLTGGGAPMPVDPAAVRSRPVLPWSSRAIDWAADDTATVLRKIRSADGVPGVRDRVAGLHVNLFDAHPESRLTGPPGALLAQHHGAVCRATVDGAVWIGHMKRRSADPAAPTLKLPAAMVLGDAAVGLPEVDGDHRDVWYEESAGVGYLHFPFYNGAMGAGQCARLLAALGTALRRAPRVLVLMGGPDFWSNGIHLNLIEAADSPADESWRTINAINDVARAVLTAGDTLTVSALAGNAGAGGVFLALAADRVWARRGAVLNPHYRGMGNLYGSEYWTYVLPRRVGAEHARAVTEARLPMGAPEAVRRGLVDEAFGTTVEDFRAGVRARAEALAADPVLPELLAEKRRRRAADEAEKPLERYREEELERMHLNFYGFDPSYHVARYNFVFKIPKSRTPLYLARHRRAD